MDAAACMQPVQKKRTKARNNRHIPSEILEKILCNLPIKSLIRFSWVSKSWSSMIFKSKVIGEHLSRRKRMVINPCSSDNLNTASTCPFSSISSNQPIEDSTDLICPFRGNSNSSVILKAFCDELWCVKFENSLFIWNPSTRTYRKLPDPSRPPYMFEFAYGFGYDSVGDDYKILRISWGYLNRPETELYSLKSDSWRKIQPFPRNNLTLDRIDEKMGVFVSGALHWMVHLICHATSKLIIFFDLSTEKYGEVAQPEYSPMLDPGDEVKVTVLRGMLCVCRNFYRNHRFVLWVMEEYGVGKSWSKKFDISYCNSISYFPSKASHITRPSYFTLKPLYFYNNGEILIKVSDYYNSDISEIFLYKDEETMPKKIVGCGHCSKISDGFLYVESLVSRAMWSTFAAPVGNNEA